VTSHRDTALPAHVTALDVASGASWASARTFAGDSPVVVAGDVAVACTPGGVVHGLALASGSELWGVTIGRHLESAPAPCRLHAGDASTVLAQGAGTRLYALDTHPPHRNVSRVLVRARVVGPGRVAGLRVRAAGTITVVIDERSLPRCMGTEAVQIDATRTRSARVTLRYGEDYCACHECD